MIESLKIFIVLSINFTRQSVTDFGNEVDILSEILQDICRIQPHSVNHRLTSGLHGRKSKIVISFISMYNTSVVRFTLLTVR